MRRAGRKPAGRAYDAMIAAAALTRELPGYAGGLALTLNATDTGAGNAVLVASVHDMHTIGLKCHHRRCGGTRQ
jgi:hypothetical protein